MVAGHVGDKRNVGKSEKSVLEIISPYPNVSAFRFGNWFWNGSQKKSKEEQDKLINMLSAPDFDVEDLQGVNFNKIDIELAKDPDGTGESDNGWATSTLTIKVPVATKITKALRRKKANADRAAQVHDEVDSEMESTGGDFCYHRIPSSQTDAYSEELNRRELRSGKAIPLAPVRTYWQPADKEQPPERIYDEIYSSTTFVKADRELQESPKELSNDLPRVIAAIMLWLDTTHVAQFDQAKLWPIYLYLGNLSKYTRCKPSEHTEHQAYCKNAMFF
jgi:hypothetical protein